MCAELAVPTTRNDWLEYLKESDFPALTQTVQQIIRVTEDSKSSVDQLRQVIIQDPGLTSQVIKVANSVVFNASQKSIRTVFQAILQLGFDEIKNIAFSVGVIHQISAGQTRRNDELLRVLASSFLAATVARCMLVNRLPEQGVDEAYIAALLGNLGEISFLADPICHHTDYFKLLGEGKSVAARAVIKMSFAELSAALLKEWQVGGLILRVHLKTAKPTPALVSVRLARQIADNLAYGIDSKQMIRLVESWASIHRITFAKAQQQIVDVAHQAIARAGAMGMDNLAQFIPTGQQQQGKSRRQLTPEQVEHRMVELMQAFGQMSFEPLNISALFELGAKGIYETTGVDRVAMIILNPRSRKPESRYVYGLEETGWKLDFEQLGDSRENQRLITWIQALKGPVWLRHEDNLSGLRIGAFAAILPDGDCLLAPLKLADRLVGFIYADANGDSLTEPVFLRYKLLASQISMAMTAAATHR